MDEPNNWRTEMADRASVIVDAADYFQVARTAMLNAKRRIMLVGWDFDARIALGDGADDDGPAHLGDFISWLCTNNPDLEFYLLRWDIGALKTLFRGSTIMTVLKWLVHPRIHTRLDRVHPTGASHHQKIVVIDDCFAFCGGIDMTADRWDTRAHLDDDPGRRTGGAPYKPWHDATTALQGPVAGALAELCRDRWRRAGGRAVAPIGLACDYWPDLLEPQFRDVAVGIARTMPDMPGETAVHEIEQLYVDQIATAKRFIYAESQYFASRRVAEAIARRLAEPDGPEIVLINPETSDGWLQAIAMDTARARLVQAIRRQDRHDRFRLYHPYTARGDPIYVHAKILTVDDRTLRVGSSNMNNRSMRLDTECDVTIDAAHPGNEGTAPAIAALRNGLIGEHLDVPAETVARTLAETGSLIATIEALRGAGRTLRPYVVPDVGDVEKWLADHEILDPEGPGEMFERPARRGLFRRWRTRRRFRRGTGRRG